MKRPSLRAAWLAVGVVAAVIAVLSACSNQGEGERCNFLNGDEDCKADEGLVCYPANQLTDKDADRCCPRDRTQATHPACVAPTSGSIGSDGSAPTDSGPAPTPEASTETEAGAETPDAS